MGHLHAVDGVLLNEILADLKALRIDYESFLKRIAELAKQVQAGKAADTPGAEILFIEDPDGARVELMRLAK